MLCYLRRIFNIKMNVNKNKSVVVILGATGTGKSKLAIEIAKKYNGEVINADSMQIYKGLDIVTNKVSKEERMMVPHHMLDFQDPLQFYNIVNFRNDVLPIIEGIHNHQKLPVVVGGTHYYLEAILWNVLVQSQHFEDMDKQTEISISKSDIFNRICVIKNFLNNIPDESVQKFLINFSSIFDVKCAVNMDNMHSHLKKNEESHYENCACNISFALETTKKLLNLLKNDCLLKLLENIDPEMAKIYHPNNTRKILRSIEVWIQTGVCHSEHIRKQSEEVGKADLGGRIRFPNTALLWIKCDKEVLDKRLDERVNTMIKQGLLEELSEFRALYLSNLYTEQPDGSLNLIKDEELFKHGIFQCIGFKEFFDYLQLNEEERLSLKGRKTYDQALEMMKVRTRQYSRRQLKWIKNRFIMRNRMKIPVYAVDGTNLSLWNENVSNIADEVVKNILNGEKPSTSPVEFQISEKDSLHLGDKTRHFCNVCSRVIIGTGQWNDHLKSAKHRMMLKRSCPKDDDDSQKVQEVL